MPKISPITAGAETKEVTTLDFTLGRQKKEKIVAFSEKQTKQVRNIFSFRARYAIREQELEGKIPSEMDQATAEVAKLLQKGKGLEELSREQMALAYFILRETGENDEYLDKAVEGLRGDKKRHERKKEKELLKRTTADFERRLVGRDYGAARDSVKRAFYRAWHGRERPTARELIYLNKLLKDHGGDVEKAAADFSGQEIVKVLEQGGKEISQDRIERAKESTNPTEKKFGHAAEQIPELAEKGMKKRREIAGWTTAEEFRQFIGRDITKDDLNDVDLIMYVLENNQDFAERYLNKYKRIDTLKQLKKQLSSWQEQGLNREANKLIQGLVKDHSFNTVVDTAIYIIDRKLPEAEETIEAVPVTKPELTAEAGKQAGESEITLMIADGKTEQEMVNIGMDLETVKAVRKKYFYKDTAGQYQLKEASDEQDVQTEKDAKKTEIQRKYKTEMGNNIDEVAKTTANEDWLKLQRGQLTANYEDDVWRIAKLILTKRDRRGGEIPLDDADRRQHLPSILIGTELQRIKQVWLGERTRNYMSNKIETGWRTKSETVEAAWQQLITKKPEIDEEYNYMISKITAQELARLKPETIALLKAKGEISASSYQKVEAALGGPTVVPEITDPAGNLKSKPEIAKKLAKKSLSWLFWAWLIMMNVVDIDSVRKSLGVEDANEIEKLFTSA